VTLDLGSAAGPTEVTIPLTVHVGPGAPPVQVHIRLTLDLRR